MEMSPVFPNSILEGFIVNTMMSSAERQHEELSQRVREKSIEGQPMPFSERHSHSWIGTVAVLMYYDNNRPLKPRVRGAQFISGTQVRVVKISV